MRMIDLFSGIGGFSLAATWVWGDELEIVSFVEIDKYCQKMLNKNFPGVLMHDNIKTFDGTKYRGTIELLTGGFPCQDISIAGKGAGLDGERSGLWSEMYRIISEVRPRFAIIENVPRLITIRRGKDFRRILCDLAAIGYDAEWQNISANDVGAPHLRKRIWIVAYPGHRTAYTNSTGRSSCKPEVVAYSPQRQDNGRERGNLDGKAESRESINSTIDFSRQDVPDSEKQIDGEHNTKQGEGQVQQSGIGISKTPVANPESDRDRYEQSCKRNKGHELYSQRRSGVGNKSINSGEDVDNTDRKRFKKQCRKERDESEQFGFELCGWWEFEPDVGRVVARLPAELDGYWDREPEGVPRITAGQKNRINRLKALGNAIVPQVVYQIMNRIKYSCQL